MYLYLLLSLKKQEYTMKHLMCLLLFIYFSYADEHRLLLTGFTKHEVSEASSGRKFNEFNYGGGYEFTTFENYDELYFASNVTVLRDSFDKPQYTLSASPNIRYRLNDNTAFSFGVAAFAMWKDELFRENISDEESQYILVFGAAPLASLYYKSLCVNFAYIPTLTYKNINPVGFGIVYFGWTF